MKTNFKIKMSIIISCLCIALFPEMATAQCQQSRGERPAWVKNGYSKALPNSTILVVQADGETLIAAQSKALQQAMEQSRLSAGQQVKVEVNSGAIMIYGNSSEQEVKVNTLDKYVESNGAGQCRVHLLVQIPENLNAQMERAGYNEEYSFSPRVFVPGMAQIHKGNTGKGIFFIAGEAALIGGIVVAESLRADNQSKINTTHNATSKQDYIDNANMYQNTRNVLIAGAVALYAWNVIDGCVAKGKKHIRVLGDAGLRIMPYAAPDMGGIVMTLDF